MRKLWRSLSGVLGETSSDVFDDHSAADFAAFFADKIDAVRASTSTTPPYNVVHSATSTMDTWPAVTTDEVKKLIDSALNKTCQLDPAPTWLVKEVGGLLSPFIALLSNKSLTTGCLPSEFKQAVVRPLLKKSGLDSSLLKNYRPVSTLSFLSKLLERVVQSRLQTYLDSNDMMPKTQSAYTVPSTAQKRHFPKCTTICCLLLMVHRSLLCVYSI